MAEFCSTRGIGYTLDEIILNGKSFIYLLTPYLKFSNTLYERLKGLNNNVELVIVYGKSELDPFQDRLLKDLNCSIYFKENLHAKCYANETEALVCSMNLYSFSEANNIEMGIKLHHRQDRLAYEKCITEIAHVVKNSRPIRELSLEKVPSPSEDKSKVFLKNWYDVLQEAFPETQFKLSANNIEAANFPLPGIQFSTTYGFSTFQLPWEQSYLRKLKDEKEVDLNSLLAQYRLYWNSPFNRMSLYKQHNRLFQNTREETIYCLAGTKELIDSIKRIAPSRM